MAVMIPEYGPSPTNSLVAEPLLYKKLRDNLDDSFSVIHSLPWLTSAVKELGIATAPTGELDFLILHKSLGLLAIEVKGGRIGSKNGSFVVLRTGKQIDPIGQVRKGVHGLARWIYSNNDLKIKIGYAVAFPECVTKMKQLPPGLYDSVSNMDICIDESDLDDISVKIRNIMGYWSNNLRNKLSIGVEN